MLRTKKMEESFVLVFFASLVSLILAANNGGVTITVNGQPQVKYVLSADWATQFTQVSGENITLRGGGRVYLGDSSSNDLSPNSYYNMPLLGKRLTFNVNLSAVGCNCNGAMYFITMPGYNSAQQLVPGEHGDYYCDANAVGGTFCPEMDVLEANRHAMSSTAHTCSYHAPHYYSTCDRGGCGTDVLEVDTGAYGPGMRIDTNRPFTLAVSFITNENGTLTTVTNDFTQDDRSFSFNACNPDYLQWMGYSLPGIVMSLSLWGTGNGGLAWLDGRSGCQGGCDLTASQVSFSNIRLDDLNTVPGVGTGGAGPSTVPTGGAGLGTVIGTSRAAGPSSTYLFPLIILFISLKFTN